MDEGKGRQRVDLDSFQPEKGLCRGVVWGAVLALVLAWWAPWVLGVGTSTAPNIGFFKAIKILYQNIEAAIPTLVFFLVIAGIWAFGTEQGRSVLSQHGGKVVAVGMLTAATTIPGLLGVTGALI